MEHSFGIAHKMRSSKKEAKKDKTKSETKQLKQSRQCKLLFLFRLKTDLRESFGSFISLKCAKKGKKDGGEKKKVYYKFSGLNAGFNYSTWS